MRFLKSVLILGLCAAMLYYGIKVVQYIKMASYPVHGIDVSRYQAKVDWKSVKEEYQFVFVKATEGNSLLDPYFHSHWQELRNIRMRRGAYHFFLPAADPGQQARHFISNVMLKPGDLPPVLDVEITQRQSSHQIVEGVLTWLNLIEQHYQVRPVIYTNYAFYRQHLQKSVHRYPVWIAYYSLKTPSLDPQ